MRPVIEICLESAVSALRAEEGGAGRVELCGDLFEGGLTPSLGTFRVARRLARNIRINVMIRPRGGDFCYSGQEFEVMREDARIFKEEGADGVVFGILLPDGGIDSQRCAALIQAVRPLPVTFHRAFDMSRDLGVSLEALISLGVDRVLTSGGEATALEGAETLAALVRQAADRIVVMPGGGINERNFQRIQKIVGAREYHLHLPSEEKSRMVFHPEHIHMGGELRQSEFAITQTDSARVERIIELSVPRQAF